MNLAHRLLRLDRRIIFLLVGLATLLPLLYPVGLPIRVSPEVRKVYDYLEQLPECFYFLLSSTLSRVESRSFTLWRSPYCNTPSVKI